MFVDQLIALVMKSTFSHAQFVLLERDTFTWMPKTVRTLLEKKKKKKKKNIRTLLTFDKKCFQNNLTVRNF